MRQWRPTAPRKCAPRGAITGHCLWPGATLILVLVMVMAGTPAYALSLGDLQVRSALGQPLEASVAVRLGAGEALVPGCIAPARSAARPGHVPQPRVATPEATGPGSYTLRVTSAGALNEPLYELHLLARCPGAPVLSRHYDLLLDLPGESGTILPAATAPAESIAVSLVASAERPAPAGAGSRVGHPTAAPIAPGSRYRVAAGDTLLGIAARLRDREDSLQARAAAIFAANPSAFIRDDANLVKLGSELLIPATGSIDRSAVEEPSTPTVLSSPAPAAGISPELGLQPALPLPATATETPIAVVPATTGPTAAAASPPIEVVDSGTTPAAEEASPVAAATAGAMFGLLVSGLLWFRERKSTSSPATSGRIEEVGDEPAAAPPTITLSPIVARPMEEPGLTVSYSLPDEEHDPLAAEFADYDEAEPESTRAMPTISRANAPQGEEITSELEKLFVSTDTGIRRQIETQTSSIPAEELLAAGSEVDFLIGNADSGEGTLNAPTVDQPRPGFEPSAEAPTLDLHALAVAAGGGESTARTLLDALTMLEKDYEEELTASQLLDTAAARQALAEDDDEPTQIREKKAGPAR